MDDKQTALQLLHEKISEGMKLTFKKLVAYKAKNDGVLVFSDQGKIIKVKAKDIKL
ncbi:hypothetical protein [Pedobacter zeae]|uniref:Trehalose-6-phosphate synthase n=1 Tax=Pedobacter zeae TaxID=1737356 RepID=A0A7W6KAD3_9SPHI|nr:hypothetical protein [Pedobacter zeae]MBB4108133.1 trehalose-6-phosphate synthase [Pedobacter zeae]GGG94785.1 hypothetical protein GCM10007422_05320 [Pedobacter zeae]